MVEGKGIIDLSIWSQKSSLTVHLVNLTNPMMMKGPIREIYPIADQTVRIRVPENRRPLKARLLVAERETKFSVEGGYIVVNVPVVNIHEVVTIDFA